MREDDRTRLALYDARAGDFMAGHGSSADLDGLWDLAKAVAQAVGVWQGVTDRLDDALERPLRSRRAARLVVEAVFDDILRPTAVGVLDAAVDLALEAPPRPLPPVSGG